MNTRWKTSSLAAAFALVALSFAAACGDDSEADVDFTEPSIRGTVTTKTDGEGDVLGTLLVEGEIEADTEYDRASVRIDGDTDIYRLEDGEPVEASWDDVAEGQTVEAWFEGAVAESYPVQAYASRIVILE